MRSDRTLLQGWLTLFTILAVTCALIFLAACGNMVEPVAVPATAVLTDTPVGSAEATQTAQSSYTPNGKEQFGTHVAMTEEAMGTSVALTAAPTRTRGRPPIDPSSTPELGLHSGAGAKNSLEPFFITGWTGIVNGELINVESGREGRLGDRQQGIIMVYNRTTQQPAEIYQTPQRVGQVRIVAVDGTRFTLAPIDFYYFETPEALQTPWTTATPGAVYIFDIATRQWVSSPLTPVPTVTNLP